MKEKQYVIPTVKIEFFLPLEPLAISDWAVDPAIGDTSEDYNDVYDGIL